jgi:hypothetical protein
VETKVSIKENDRLQLIEPARIAHIAGLDRDGLWQLMVTEFAQLRRRDKFRSPVLHAPKDADMAHIEKVFNMFYDEDPDDIRWGLMYDLGFIGEPIRINGWAASGYLDDASSVGLTTSRELITDGETREHYQACRFDVIEAFHVDLIARSLANFKNLGFEDDPISRLKVRSMSDIMRNDENLKAAYIYEMPR